MIKEEIKNLVEKALKKINFNKETILIDVPKEKTHGDYSTNIALVLAKKINKNPTEVSKDIIKNIKNDLFEKIEIAGPGFINFYLKKEFFIDNLKKIDKNFGKNNSILKGEKIIVEHTQPNPFKPFHIGHLMNNAIGESVTRILLANGATVKAVSYHGDVGLHVAKAVWSIMKKQTNTLGGGKVIIYNPKNAFELGEDYQIGNEAFERDTIAKREILEINKNIYNIDPKKEYGIMTSEGWYQEGRKISINHFNDIYKRLDSNFEHHFYESQVGEYGKKLVTENVGKVFNKGNDNTIIFRGENFKPKTHTRVFITSEGLPTYEAKEVGLAKAKKDWWNYNLSITITANEQSSFFDVVEVVIGEILPKVKGKLRHLSHGLLKLPSGKMSSRTGQVITAESLIEKMKGIVLEKMKERDLPEKEKDEISEKVAIGAIKYSILKQSIGSDIIYDFEKSISFEGDSGPYLQYSLVRANSVLEKAKQEGVKPSFKYNPDELSRFEKLMTHFPEVVEKAGEKYEPHLIATYLIDLAREFNNYYARNKIVDKLDKFSSYKVSLTKSFSIITKNGLWLLGIPAPEKM